jgi:hypothetical protein
VPLDHVNGLLLLEAAQQAAIAAACRELDARPEGLIVSEALVSYLSFAELDRPTHCHVDLDGERATVLLSQTGWTATKAELRVERL